MSNVLSPLDLVSRPDNMDETVTHICTICTRVKFYTRVEICTLCVPFIRHLIVSIRTRFHLTFGIRYSVLMRFEYAVF